MNLMNMINIKPIDLTEEQKNKLLEMCQVLFPELDNLEIRDSMEDFNFPFEHICVEFNRNKNLTIIHWFEFCTRFLMSKLDALYIEKVLDPVDPYGNNNYISYI